MPAPDFIHQVEVPELKNIFKSIACPVNKDAIKNPRLFGKRRTTDQVNLEMWAPAELDSSLQCLACASRTYKYSSNYLCSPGASHALPPSRAAGRTVGAQIYAAHFLGAGAVLASPGKPGMDPSMYLRSPVAYLMGYCFWVLIQCLYN